MHTTVTTVTIRSTHPRELFAEQQFPYLKKMFTLALGQALRARPGQGQGCCECCARERVSSDSWLRVGYGGRPLA